MPLSGALEVRDPAGEHREHRDRDVGFGLEDRGEVAPRHREAADGRRRLDARGPRHARGEDRQLAEELPRLERDGRATRQFDRDGALLQDEHARSPPGPVA